MVHMVQGWPGVGSIKSGILSIDNIDIYSEHNAYGGFNVNAHPTAPYDCDDLEVVGIGTVTPTPEVVK